MKTNRSLVVIVSLITATLLLTACAQPEQSSLAGDWLLTPKDKTRGLTGSIADYVSESGFFGSMMHVGIIELRRCQSENCQQELKAINTH